jgi:multiple sugar transport system substrate-binding protein
MTTHNRRRFLKTSGLAAAGVAVTRAIGQPRWAAAKEPLGFAFWPWGSEIVTENAKLFEKEFNEQVNLQPIPGEYAAVVETKLAAKAPIDMFYAQRGQAARWYAAGWIRPIDDMPDLEQIKKEMFPGIVEDSRAPDGKFIGLTYYNGGPFCLFRNEKVLGAAGYKATKNPTDYPQTWDEVFKQCLEIKKKKIVEQPFLPGWYKAWTGLPWALIAQCFSEGDYMADVELRATFGPDTGFRKVLEDWKRFWDADLIPRSILTWQDTQMSNSWMKGLHAFHPYIDYQSFLYNDPKLSQIQEYNNQNPVMPGATHDTVLVGHAMLSMYNRPRSDEDTKRVFNLMKFYGWKDKQGRYQTHKKWVAKANLEVPFPAIYSDAEAKGAILKWMYPPLAEEEYKWLFDGRLRAKAPNVLKAPWYQEWDAPMHDMISNDVLLKGSKKPLDATRDLRALWDKLHAKYSKKRG